MWTPITGKADYTNGKSVFPYRTTGVGVINGTAAIDPFKNTLGQQDYTTYYQGGNGKSITPGTGVKNAAAPLAGGPYPYHE